MGFGKLDFIEIPPKIKKQYQYYSRANVSLLRKAGYRKKFLKINKSIKMYIKKLEKKIS